VDIEIMETALSKGYLKSRPLLKRPN